MGEWSERGKWKMYGFFQVLVFWGKSRVLIYIKVDKYGKLLKCS